MLKPPTFAPRLTAFGAARARHAGGLLEAAGRALDQSLEQWPEARQASLMIYSGARFIQAREDEPWNPSEGALLDNHYATEVITRLLLARDMPSVQPYGVLLADDAPFLAGVRAARSFLHAEGLEPLVIVAIEPPSTAASAVLFGHGDLGLLLVDLGPALGAPGPEGDLVERVEGLRRFEQGAPDRRRLILHEGEWAAEFLAAGARTDTGLEAPAP